MRTQKQRRLSFQSNGNPWAAKGILAAKTPQPRFGTELGVLFQGDCLEVLPKVKSEAIDTVFARPAIQSGKEVRRKDERQSA